MQRLLKCSLCTARGSSTAPNPKKQKPTCIHFTEPYIFPCIPGHAIIKIPIKAIVIIHAGKKKKWFAESFCTDCSERTSRVMLSHTPSLALGIERRTGVTEHTRKSPTRQTYPPSKPLFLPYLSRKVMQPFFIQADVFLLGRLRFLQDQILKADNKRAVGDYAVLAGLVDGNCLTEVRALLIFFAIHPVFDLNSRVRMINAESDDRLHITLIGSFPKPNIRGQLRF